MHTAAPEVLFRELLVSLRDLFLRVDEYYWAEWLQLDLDAWDDDRDVTHHLVAHRAAVGRLPDAVPHAPDSQRVPPHLLPWLNAALGVLKRAALALAEAQYGGTSTPTLAAIVPPVVPEIPGRVCPKCGRSEVHAEDIEDHVARRVVRSRFLRETDGPSPNDLLDLRSLAVLPEAEALRLVLRGAAIRSGIRVEDGARRESCLRCLGPLQDNRWRLERRTLDYELVAAEPGEANARRAARRRPALATHRITGEP